MVESLLYPWQRTYPEQLGLQPSNGLKLPDCMWVFPKTDQTLTQWRDMNIPIQMNMVIVSPNEGQLPLRALAYIQGAADMIRALGQSGQHVDTLRIINPCYLNAFVNNGDLLYQLEYGQQLLKGIIDWFRRMNPDLQNLQFSLDQGKPVSSDLLAVGQNYAAPINHETLRKVMDRIYRHYQEVEDDETGADHQGTYNEQMATRAALYLLGHPTAWNYYIDMRLFENRYGAHGVVNYMPQSEMLYMETMREAGVRVAVEQSNIVSLLSKRIIQAPYYPILRDELPFDWSVEQHHLMTARKNMKKDSGRNTVREVMDIYGYLMFSLQKKRKA